MSDSTVSRELNALRMAEWEGYKRLAKRLPDHHVLAVQMIRTQSNETAAVFTTVRNGEPVRSVLLGDSRGRPYPNQHTNPRIADVVRAEALIAPAGIPTSGPVGGTSTDTGASPDTIALGDPPVKQPITPGLISLGTTLLAATFDLGETVESGSSK